MSSGGTPFLSCDPIKNKSQKYFPGEAQNSGLDCFIYSRTKTCSPDLGRNVPVAGLFYFAYANQPSGGALGMHLSGAGEGVSERRADGTEQRIIQMYDTLRPSLYRYLIHSGIAPQDVEEVVQEAFLRLYRHLQAGGGDENLRAWVYQVVHNLSCNFRKSQRRLVDAGPEMWDHLSQSTPDHTPGPEERLLEKERYFRIHEGLSKLTQLQRDCLNLRLEGFRYREIGEILNVGTSTVAGSLRNAMTKLVKGGA